MHNSNATASALNQTQDYFTVFDEVSKYNVHLNVFERLWAVRPTISLPWSLVVQDMWWRPQPSEAALSLYWILTWTAGLVPLVAE